MLRNITDLNGLVSENQHEVVIDNQGNGGVGGGESARFAKKKAIVVTLFKDGFKLDSQVSLSGCKFKAVKFFGLRLLFRSSDGFALIRSLLVRKESLGRQDKRA